MEAPGFTLCGMIVTIELCMNILLEVLCRRHTCSVKLENIFCFRVVTQYCLYILVIYTPN